MEESSKRIKDDLETGCSEERSAEMLCPVCGDELRSGVHPEGRQFFVRCKSNRAHFEMVGETLNLLDGSERGMAMEMPESYKRIKDALAVGCSEEELAEMRCPICGSELDFEVHPEGRQFFMRCQSDSAHLAMTGETLNPPDWYENRMVMKMPASHRRIKDALTAGCSQKEFAEMRCPICGDELRLAVDQKLRAFHVRCQSDSTHLSMHGEILKPPEWYRNKVTIWCQDGKGGLVNGVS